MTSYHSVKGGTGKSTLAIAHALFLSQECEEKVAVLDLDMLNPSLLAMRIFAKVHEPFEFLEPILTSSRPPDAGDMERALMNDNEYPNILFGSVFGPSRGRDLLSRMLSGHLETWQIVVDNLRILVEFLFAEKQCSHVILDNSPGFLGVAIPSAIVAAEHAGTFVLVSTLDTFDIGNIPLNQAAYDSLFRHRRRVIVLNKIPNDERIKSLKLHKEVVLVQAWREAVSRAGLAVVDVSPQHEEKVSNVSQAIEDGESYLFINVAAMLKEREEWKIEFVEYSAKLAAIWTTTLEVSATRSSGDVNMIRSLEEIQDFLKLITSESK